LDDDAQSDASGIALWRTGG